MISRTDRIAFFVGAVLLSSTAMAQSTEAAAERDQSGTQETQPSPATAPPRERDEEILITAQRRTEALQDVPLAVTAFTDTDLQTRQISNTLDLVNYVPNLVGHNNTALGTANTYSLRGLANTESIATFDPPVGTYVDEVYVSRQGANNFAFFDVERIEVLRGPQGTLFGRNTTGGAINIIMRPPAEELRGYVEAGYGRYDRVQLRGSVHVPLIEDRLLSNVAAYYIRSDGYLNNLVTGERLNGEESYGVRGAIRARITDTVQWDVTADYISSTVANLPHFWDRDEDERITFIPFRSDTPIGSALVSSRLADNTLDNTAESYSLTSNVEVDAGLVTINFITGYRHLYQEFMTESFAGISSASLVLDGLDFVSANRGFSTPLVSDSWHRQFSQEIKVTGEAFDGLLDYVGGLYYINENNETDFANITVPLTGPARVSGDRVVTNDTTAYAAYFQGDFHFTDALTMTAGLRYTDERKTIGFSPNPNPLARTSALNQPFDTQDLINAGVPVELNSEVWTPRLAFEYNFNPDLMAFVSATRGFKSGGWNARAFYAAAAQAFTRETIWSYEAGVRSEWLDRRVRVNLTGFYFNTYDLQLPGGGLDPVTGTITYLTRNVADMENYGLEAEILVRPVRGLNVYWNFGIQDARYTNLNQSTQEQQARCLAGIVANNCNAGIITPSVDVAVPTRAPSFTSAVGFNYSYDLGGGLALEPSVNWVYVSDSWVSTSNDPRGLQKSHSLVNAGLTLRGDDRWSVGIECNNCFDDVYRTSFLIYPYLSAPGSWMVRTRFNF
ncbi:MAG TPA: TonB-dependent receptor [Allosphingosinicella sp.]|nr:TonB-dependent receptor [Allosphingosinicella sp.]